MVTYFKRLLDEVLTEEKRDLRLEIAIFSGFFMFREGPFSRKVCSKDLKSPLLPRGESISEFYGTQ